MIDDDRRASASVDVVVVGAGLSGLVVAHRLQRAGYRVRVVEASSRAGGVIGTREHDGFVYETAANTALDNASSMRALIDELGIASERVEASTASAKRYIVRDGRLQPLPTSPPALITTSTFSLPARLRLLREPFIAPAPADAEESVAAFIRRRLGREWLDYAIDPFVSGVHAGDPEALSLRAAFPRLHALEQEHRSLLRGQVRAARERGGAPAPRSFSFKSGMQTFTDALARRVDVTLSAPVSSIRPSGARWQVTVDSATPIDARAVVVATPAPAAASLVASLAPQAASVLETIDHAPVAIVVAAFRRDDIAHPLDGFGMLVPARERRSILGTLFSSSLFEHRAPREHVLLTTFAGGTRARHIAAMDDAALERIVGAELEALLGARAPLWMDVVRWPRAIPQYTLGHDARIASIDAALAAHPTLFPSGSWRGGVSVGDRVTQGERIAGAVQRALGTPAVPAR